MVRIFTNDRSIDRARKEKRTSLIALFSRRHALLQPPFVIYADIETKNEPPPTEERPNEKFPEKNTIKINELKPYLIAYYIRFSDRDVFGKHPELRNFEKVQIFEGLDCMENMFIKLKKDCYDVKSIVRSQEALAWNNDLESRYRSETACGICKQPYNRRKNDHMNFSRVRHHCHLTGEPFEISHAKKSGKAFFAQLKSIFRIFSQENLSAARTDCAISEFV